MPTEEGITKDQESEETSNASWQEVSDNVGNIQEAITFITEVHRPYSGMKNLPNDSFSLLIKPFQSLDLEDCPRVYSIDDGFGSEWREGQVTYYVLLNSGELLQEAARGSYYDDNASAMISDPEVEETISLKDYLNKLNQKDISAIIELFWEHGRRKTYRPEKEYGYSFESYASYDITVYPRNLHDPIVPRLSQISDAPELVNGLQKI